MRNVYFFFLRILLPRGHLGEFRSITLGNFGLGQNSNEEGAMSYEKKKKKRIKKKNIGYIPTND